MNPFPNCHPSPVSHQISNDFGNLEWHSFLGWPWCHNTMVFHLPGFRLFIWCVCRSMHAFIRACHSTHVQIVWLARVRSCFPLRWRGVALVSVAGMDTPGELACDFRSILLPHLPPHFRGDGITDACHHVLCGFLPSLPPTWPWLWFWQYPRGYVWKRTVSNHRILETGVFHIILSRVCMPTP